MRKRMRAHTRTQVRTHAPTSTHPHVQTHIHTLSLSHTHTQINHKYCGLGQYAVEADAAAARDVVARVLGYPLNFKRRLEIMGPRTEGADRAVADAVKAANALMLGGGNSVTFGIFGTSNQNRNFTTVNPLFPVDP